VALGLSAPFADKAADFSQLSPQPLYISDVLQSVSEKAAQTD
jgi:serine protease inhibitor